MAGTVTAAGGPPFFRRSEVQFPVRFVALAAVMAGVWAALGPFWPTLTAGTAGIVAWIARSGGLSAITNPGSQVVFGDAHTGFRFAVTEGCTGLTMIMIYTAAVLAYPATGRQRMVGLATGVPLLFVFNLLRLVALGWVGLHARAHFDSAHQYWAEALGIALVGAVWFGWVRFLANARKHTAASSIRATRASPGSILSRRIRYAAPRISALCGVLVLLGILGLAAHGVAIWVAIVMRPLVVLAPLIGTHAAWPVPDHLVLNFFGMHYASLAAVLALFSITPSVPWRTRMAAALLIGVPAVYLAQVATGILELVVASTFHTATSVQTDSLAASSVVDSFLNSALLATHIAIPAIVWHHWVRQTKPESSAHSFSDETTQTDVSSSKVTVDPSQTKGAT